jgi:hypothetical protein
MLINMSEEQQKNLLRMRCANKDETMRIINEQIKIIYQITERVDALCENPLSYRRLPHSPQS